MIIYFNKPYCDLSTKEFSLFAYFSIIYTTVGWSTLVMHVGLISRNWL